MTARSLAEWLAYVETAHPRAWDLGLERVHSVAGRLGLLPPAPTSIVVAGTNGKGSTSIYAEALLRAAGWRLGTTLSPHLSLFNERIRVDARLADDATIVTAFEAVEAARGEITLTYFEYGILAALHAFRQAAVDVAVLEVGLGGRLDAVNIVDGQVTVITSIGLDHQDYLGHDLESIGAEKAGILRAGVPCVFGEERPPKSVARRAGELGVPLRIRGRDYGFEADVNGVTWRFWRRTASGTETHAGLARPAVALANAAAALEAALLVGRVRPGDVGEITAQSATARLPGRFECHRFGPVEVVLDVAHNPHGARFLAEQLDDRRRRGRVSAVMGCLKDKDAAGIVAALGDAVDEWCFVDSGTGRGQTGGETRAKVEHSVRAVVDSDAVAAVQRFVAAARDGDCVVVLGSFDVVRRIRTWLRAQS